MKHFFIPPFAPGTQKVEFISDPTELITTTLLEMCFIATATVTLSNEKQKEQFSSQLSGMMPRETLMELNPDIFKEYVRPAQSRYGASFPQNFSERDIWIKRYYQFPLPNVDAATMKRAFETGNMDLKSTLRGRTAYREV